MHTRIVQAVTARLEALENDAAAPDAAGGDSDDEFVLPADSDAEEAMQFGPASSKRRKGQKGSGGGKRKTRGMAAERGSSRGSARTFAALLEDVSGTLHLDVRQLSAAGLLHHMWHGTSGLLCHDHCT